MSAKKVYKLTYDCLVSLLELAQKYGYGNEHCHNLLEQERANAEEIISKIEVN